MPDTLNWYAIGEVARCNQRALPALDGWELARLLKTDPQTDSIPLIAVSATDRTRDDVGCDGCLDGFVAKPFEVTELENTLRSVLALA